MCKKLIKKFPTFWEKMPENLMGYFFDSLYINGCRALTFALSRLSCIIESERDLCCVLVKGDDSDDSV